MTALQAIVIAILQGATELFPVSSLGHAVVLPALLGWGINQNDPSFLPFLVMLHVGTAVALLLYFWRDWWALLRGVLGLDTAHQVRESRRVLVLIIVATIPAVIVGGAAGALPPLAVRLPGDRRGLSGGERRAADGGRAAARPAPATAACPA